MADPSRKASQKGSALDAGRGRDRIRGSERWYLPTLHASPVKARDGPAETAQNRHFVQLCRREASS